MQPSTPEKAPHAELLVAAALVVLAVVAAQFLFPDLHFVHSVRQVVLSLITLLFAVALVFSLARGAPFELRTHWGGLGGGLGGWRLSAPVVYLLGTLAFGALTVSLQPPIEAPATAPAEAPPAAEPNEAPASAAPTPEADPTHRPKGKAPR